MYRIQTLPGHKWIARWVIALAAVVGAVFLVAAFSARSAEPTQQQESVPVATALVTKRTVPIELRAIGNVEAYNAVAVRSLVAGELMKIHFQQGQDVKKGDLLFTIDPRPLEAALDQAQATLARDVA